MYINFKGHDRTDCRSRSDHGNCVCNGNNKIIGDYGEKVASHYLISKGFSIIRQNLRLKVGEIDILAKKNSNLYIFEIKTARFCVNHTGEPFVFPEENFNHRKLRKLQSLREELYCRLGAVLSGVVLNGLRVGNVNSVINIDINIAGLAIYLSYNRSSADLCTIAGIKIRFFSLF